MSEGKKRGRLLVIPLLVLALAGAGYGGYVLGAANVEAAPPREEPEPVEGEVVEVGVLTVSLSGPQGQYARVGLAVVLADGHGEDEVSGKFALVKDAALSIIAGKTGDDFRTAAGLERLRRELTSAVGEIYPDGEVLRVVLTEAIVS